MSTGLVGTIGSLATGQLQQARSADSDRTHHEVSNHARRSESAQSAENAAGIGQMQEDGETSERDADGRRLWERPQEKGSPPSGQIEPEATSTGSKDPAGEAGNQLDLSG